MDLEAIFPQLHDDFFIKNGFSIENILVNLSKFDNPTIVSVEKRSEIFTVKEKETGYIFSAEVFKTDINKLFKVDKINFPQLLFVMSKLKHPLFLQFIGFSPFNFSNKRKPTIITEYAPKRKLSAILELDKIARQKLNWDSTKKLITIYGIASGMKYLHSKNIIHRGLKPNNILLDDSFYPKIINFSFSQNLDLKQTQQDDPDINENAPYIAPEVWTNKEYSKASDVYAFSFIVYEILFNKNPIKKLKGAKKIMNAVVKDKYRPLFLSPIPDCYKALIESCWAVNPKNRPSFDEIVNILKIDPNYQTSRVDKDEFLKYVNSIESIEPNPENAEDQSNTKSGNLNEKTSQNLNEKSNQNLNEKTNQNLNENEDQNLNEKTNQNLNEETNQNLNENKDQNLNKKTNQNLNEETNHNLNEKEDQNYNSNADQVSKSKNLTAFKIPTINEDIMKINKVDITQFEKLNKINSDILSEIFEVKNIKTGESMSCKCFKFDEIVDDLGFDLVNEIHSMSMMDHSSILKFIGYSPINFSNEQTPVIFTESVNYTLSEVIKSKPKNWNNTKKLINIYGIASGIKYLHDNSIHHLNLNPNRILLDSSLYPKITGYGDYIFNYNKQFQDNYNESPYLSPNYYDEKYGIKNDIYSFGLIVFLIMEGFNEFDMFYLINKSIYLNDYRPKLSMGIPSCYQNLIESCWIKNPYNRPSIDDIIYALRNDSNFISNDVDKEEFINYVNNIDKISIKSESQIDVKPEIVFDSYPYLDSNKIDKLQNYKILDVNENFELIKLISKLSHPVLLNFYGYLPSQKLSIVTDEPKKSLFIYSWARVENERWNLTMKLIIIYGIASVLKYLNSINKSIKELNLDNIFLDEFLFPKIHPLNISDNEYLKNDLFMYAKLVYVILTGSKLPNDITKIDDSSIPDCYKNLIKSCLTNDKFDFDQIEIQLRTDKSFITNDIDEKKYYQYIYYIGNKHFSKINIFDEYNLMKPVQRIFFDPEIFFNINQFEKGKLIGEGAFSKVYIVSKKKEKDRYALKVYKKEHKFISNEERIDIYREIQINSKINHKSILKFIGYSPVNFKHKQKMCILMELANTTLKDVINKESNSLAPDGWDETKKYINIYGIAAGMKYLHSLDIIHRDLKPYNILVDQYLFPKICDFGLSKKIHNNFNSISIDSIKGFKGTPVYSAPEIFDNFAYSKASDVFSFGMILYEMVVLEEPNKIVHNKRPIFRYKIPVVFYTLIEKCWAQKPEDRLTFDEIVTILSDEKYIPDYVDYNDFLDYVDYIEEKLEVDPSELFKKFDSDVDQYHDIQQLNLPREILPFNVDFTQYKKLEKLGSGSFGKVYKVKNEITSETLAAKVLQKETDYLEEINKIDLIREIKGLIEVRNKHSFIKFIGFSLISFKNSHKPVILTEFAANKSLGDIIKLVRQGNAPKEWNDTLKLINVYGIAYGMKYLHSKKILHRDLKPDNVLLDKSLYPLITDFGLSKLINDELNSKRNYYAGTLGYISPEILEDYSYSEKSDVYAYALTVYEIITNEVLYKDLKSNLMLHVAKGKRPVFDSVIPNCYKRLIERCWAQNPKDRPSFAQILSLISFDPDFITDDIDIDDFEFYVKKIGGDFTLFEETIMKKFANESNRKENPPIIKEKEISIPKINETINQSTISLFNKIVEKQSNANDCFLDLNDYQKTNEVIIKGELNKVLKVIQKSSGEDYSCIISNIDMTQFSEKEMQDIIEQTNIISQINHPAILKFIGFSPSNFKEEPKPTIITEMITRKRLFDILEFAKNNNSLVDWNNTKKFINIFGIASGMKCLHSFGIIHSNLNPKSIYLDVNMYPKMTDFGRLTQILVFNSMTYTDNFNKTSKIINSENSSKEKDVFEFGVIAYQIMMGEMPFENNLLTFNPDKKLPNCYKSLIEKCLSKNPNERPSFDDIVTTIENDIDFIMYDMNNDEISEYIKNTKCDCDEIDEI